MWLRDKVRQYTQVSFKFRFRVHFGEVDLSFQNAKKSSRIQIWEIPIIPPRLCIQCRRGDRIVSTSEVGSKWIKQSDHESPRVPSYGVITPEATDAIVGCQANFEEAAESGVLDSGDGFEIVVSLTRDRKSIKFDSKNYEFLLIHTNAKLGEKEKPSASVSDSPARPDGTVLGRATVDFADWASFEGAQQEVKLTFLPQFASIGVAKADCWVTCSFMKEGKPQDDDMVSTWSHVSEEECPSRGSFDHGFDRGHSFERRRSLERERRRSLEKRRSAGGTAPGASAEVDSRISPDMRSSLEKKDRRMSWDVSNPSSPLYDTEHVGASAGRLSLAGSLQRFNTSPFLHSGSNPTSATTTPKPPTSDVSPGLLTHSHTTSPATHQSATATSPAEAEAEAKANGTAPDGGDPKKRMGVKEKLMRRHKSTDGAADSSPREACESHAKELEALRSQVALLTKEKDAVERQLRAEQAKTRHLSEEKRALLDMLRPLQVGTELKGWLMMRVVRGPMRLWKRYYFIREGSQLNYYPSEDNRKRVGFIDLTAIMFVGVAAEEYQDKTQCTFFMKVRDGEESQNYWLAAKDMDDMKCWIDVLDCLREGYQKQ